LPRTLIQMARGIAISSIGWIMKRRNPFLDRGNATTSISTDRRRGRRGLKIFLEKQMLESFCDAAKPRRSIEF